MKKIFLIAILTSIISCAVFAQAQDFTPPRDESKWSDISYVCAPVLKILEARDYYVVLYQKKYAGTATVVIPKEWNVYKKDTPRKLRFRNEKNPDFAYLTVVKKGGEFQNIILNVPMKKNNKLWGVISSDKHFDGADKETLEELDI